MRDDMAVFEVSASTEDYRPSIDFDDRANQGIDWKELDEVLLGQRPIGDYRQPSIFVSCQDAIDWGFYQVPGTLGLISAEAVQLVGRDAFRLYKLLPARLNDREFFFLKAYKTLSCLDSSRSDIVYFRSDPDQVKEIRRYAFDKQAIPDPIFFSIPEVPDLFATPGVREVIVGSGARGFSFTPVA
jgi:hypothetical protein